jgi:hypothetical protein
MPSMIPYLRMYLNEVTSFLMLGELIYPHLSKTATSSPKVKVFVGAPSGLSSSSPTSSLVASITIEEFFASGVLSTCFPRRVRLRSLKSWYSPCFIGDVHPHESCDLCQRHNISWPHRSQRKQVESCTSCI